MRFGPVAIEGLERLNPAYVEGRLRWQPNEIYDASKVAETRRVLIETGLFSTVQITPVADPDNPKDVRVTIDATERLHRTIGAGLAYNTSQGSGARAFWENRNLSAMPKTFGFVPRPASNSTRSGGIFAAPIF